ncbi:MAG TPA: HupE/UreJ family protein [Opitutaceae bacterium]
MAGATAWAHDPGLSTAEVSVSAERIEIVNGFAPDDAKLFLPEGRRGVDRWDEETFPEVRPALEAVARQLWVATEGGRPLVLRSARVQLLPGDNVSFFLDFVREGGAGPLVFEARKIGGLPTGHRQFVIISDAYGSALAKKLLRDTDASIEALPPGSSSASATTAGGRSAGSGEGDLPTFGGFFKLGVEHIWMGYDHLLFLFALLVVCRTVRKGVAIITSFTIAHSVTLGLATLQVVDLPGRWVEPLIAASIVFVGVENFLRRGAEPRGRWALTFGFGLIHGFGFASVLRDLGVGAAGKSDIALPLFAFNLGVEIGQLAIAAVALPLLWQLRKSEAFVKKGVPVLSAVVALAGLYWLLERTVF